VGGKAHQFGSMGAHCVDVPSAESKLDPNVAAFDPAELCEFVQQSGSVGLPSRRVVIPVRQYTDATHTVILLRPRHHRPRRRAAEPGDDLPPVHSITSSARSRIDCGTVRPSALAVLRFTTISNLVGNCTGRSPGFSPCRMRST